VVSKEELMEYLEPRARCLLGCPRGPGWHCLCHWLGAWGVCVPMVGAHRHSPGHGGALGPLALLECGGRLRTVCALLGVYGCACRWLTPALAWSRQCPWAAGIVGMRRSASHSMCVAWCVCRCLRQRSAVTLNAGDSVPWHRTYRYWSKPETGHHCPWSSLLSNKPAVALKPVIACLGTGLIGGEASLRKGTTAPGPLFLQIVRMGGER